MHVSNKIIGIVISTKTVFISIDYFIRCLSFQDPALLLHNYQNGRSQNQIDRSFSLMNTEIKEELIPVPEKRIRLEMIAIKTSY